VKSKIVTGVVIASFQFLSANMFVELTNLLPKKEIKTEVNSINLPEPQQAKRLRCDFNLDKGVINICYSKDTNGALKVVYSLSGELVDKGNIDKRPRFYREKRLPKRYQVKPSDYTYTTSSTVPFERYINHLEPLENLITFDRGHLAPDADFDYDKKALLKVYTMANIAPQESILNRKLWVKAEKYERMVAKRLGKVEIETGTMYDSMGNILVKRPIELIPQALNWKKNKVRKYLKQAEQLKKKHIVIPAYFYKKITNKEAGFEKCFLYKNKKYTKEEVRVDRLKDHLIDCSHLPNYR